MLKKIHMIKAMVFPVVMYGYDSWTIKKLSAKELMPSKTVMLEEILESPLDYKDIKPVNPKGNQSFIGRTDAEAEVPILWPLNTKN